MDKIREWLRQWLGLEAADVLAESRHAEMKLRQDSRHKELIGICDRIEKRMIAGHVDQPREFTSEVLDWDTVQAIALHNLEKNPEN